MSVYSAATIREVMGVEPATLRQWVKRGHVQRVGRDAYDGDSVIEHWRTTSLSTDVRDQQGRYAGRTMSTDLSPACE